MSFNRFGLHPATTPWETWCDRLGIRLVQAEEPEVAGMWDWLGEGEACDQSFDTRLDAAENAIRTRYPPEDWRYQVANEDTTAGYLDWIESQVDDDADAPVVIEVPFGLTVTRVDGALALSSGLHDAFADADGNLDEAAKVSVDALESLLLALAGEGCDITRPPVTTALQTSVEAICNQFS